MENSNNQTEQKINKQAKVTILDKKVLLEKFLRVEEAVLEVNEKKFTRLNIISPDSVGMVLFNMETKNVIMLEQYRYAANEYILEIPSGRIEVGENDIAAAARETLEETGYSIQGKKMERICTYYPNVGSTSERITLFLVPITNKDKIKDINNDDNIENEMINLKEFSIDEIIAMMDNGTLQDSKSIIGLNHLVKLIISQMYSQAIEKIKENQTTKQQ